MEPDPTEEILAIRRELAAQFGNDIHRIAEETRWPLVIAAAGWMWTSEVSRARRNRKSGRPRRGLTPKRPDDIARLGGMCVARAT